MNNVYDIVKETIERNILIFDVNAKPEELTDRLLSLTVYYAEVELKLGKVSKFYIPKILADPAGEKIYTTVEHDKIVNLEIKVEYKIPRAYITDFTYIFTDDLQGSLAYQDKYLIIAECWDGKFSYLAGSC